MQRRLLMLSVGFAPCLRRQREDNCTAKRKRTKGNVDDGRSRPTLPKRHPLFRHGPDEIPQLKHTDQAVRDYLHCIQRRIRLSALQAAQIRVIDAAPLSIVAIKVM